MARATCTRCWNEINMNTNSYRNLTCELIEDSWGEIMDIYYAEHKNCPPMNPDYA